VSNSTYFAHQMPREFTIYSLSSQDIGSGVWFKFICHPSNHRTI